MQEFFGAFVAIAMLCTVFFLGCLFGRLRTANAYMDAMTRVGIEKIVYCNNT